MSKDYCRQHGTQEFFVALDEYEGEYDYIILCPLCHPNHQDNPKVIKQLEEKNERECNAICAL